MKCPACGGETRVVDCREESPEVRWRRRGCVRCGVRFNTVEIPQGLYRKLTEEEEDMPEPRRVFGFCL